MFMLIPTTESRGGRTPSVPVAHGAGVVNWEHKGFTLATWSENELYNSGPALQQLADSGANSVTYAVNWYTPHQYSTDIFRTSATATDASLIWSIQKARSLGLTVWLKPHLDSQDGVWRASINPSNADLWFRNYTTLINRYADMGRDQGAVGLAVGAELISMSTNPAYEGRWRTLIADVRGRFPGKLTYSANWGSGDFAEEFPRIRFWDALDYIGISAYFELTTSTSPTVAQLKASWNNWKTTKIAPVQQRWGKPVMFVEGGYRSVDGAARQPWNWSDGSTLDVQEQVDCYAALFETWADVPWFVGGAFWHWSPDANTSPSDIGYLVQNKPGYQTVKSWFGSGAGTTSPAPTTTDVSPASVVAGGAGTVVRSAYSDGIAAGWANWSWNGSINFAHPIAYAGSRAIWWRIDAAWGGLYLHTDQAVQSGAASSLRFVLRASRTDQRLLVAVYGEQNQLLGYQPLSAVGGNPTVSSWKAYDVPLSSLSAAGQRISGILLQDNSGAPQPAIEVDEISLAGIPGGSSDMVLTVNGTNFVNGSTVQWTGANRVTTFVSATRVTATILAADIAAAGSYRVTVVNPAPGGGVSNAQTVTVNPR